MEILDSQNIVMVIGLIGSIITIWKFSKGFWKKDKNFHIISSSQQINIIKQNNIVPYTKDNESFTLTINKETLKNIAIFIAGIICCYLAYKTYKHLSLKVQKLYKT
ncbi:hypothetical protein HEGA106846_05975 [Helicobacter ganmani]|uniref:hypothetical protein n=1 Tax=Helicobacter ganmani TaxID=60246 RepID=UPI0039EC3F78